MSDAAYKDHPVASIFPLLNEGELKELADDIKANGLRERICLFEGKILDGRNRYRACKLAGVEPTFKEFSNGSPTAFVISLNLKRRHLTSDQAACAAVRALEFYEKEAKERQRKGKEKIPDPESIGQARDKAAADFHTNAHYVSDAKAILEDDPKAFNAIERGEKTLSQVKRERRKTEISKRLVSMPTAKHRVVYADPPWKYGDTRELDGWEATAAEHHYPTMSIADLCAMPVADIVENDAVLFLWVTSPLLDECWPVIKAWGFDYRASFVWDKVRHNVGNYNSVRHEFLLVCVRGNCTPEVKKLYDSVQSIERKGHSEKPEAFRDIIDTLYPHGKRIEMFARKKTKGWESWGNQA